MSELERGFHTKGWEGGQAVPLGVGGKVRAQAHPSSVTVPLKGWPALHFYWRLSAIEDFLPLTRYFHERERVLALSQFPLVLCPSHSSEASFPVSRVLFRPS